MQERHTRESTKKNECILLFEFDTTKKRERREYY